MRGELFWLSRASVDFNDVSVLQHSEGPRRRAAVEGGERLISMAEDGSNDDVVGGFDPGLQEQVLYINTIFVILRDFQ